MLPFREERVRNLKTYLGRHYNGESTSERVPVNMLEVAVQIYRRNLVTANPSVRVRTDKKPLRPAARKFQLAITKVLKEIDFQESMNTIVFDALFGLGVAKIGITDKALGEMRGYLHDGGYPFMDAVDLDDLVLDMNSKHWEGMQFLGNRYELPYEDAMESDVFDFKKKPSPKPQQSYNEYGEMKVSSIGSKATSGSASYTRQSQRQSHATPPDCQPRRPERRFESHIPKDCPASRPAEDCDIGCCGLRRRWGANP